MGGRGRMGGVEVEVSGGGGVCGRGWGWGWEWWHSIAPEAPRLTLASHFFTLLTPVGFNPRSSSSRQAVRSSSQSVLVSSRWEAAADTTPSSTPVPSSASTMLLALWEPVGADT